jgi:hypothetical protein
LLSSREATEQEEHKSRAQRFPIEAPLRYRAEEESAWTEGATVNISRSGILFRAEKEIPPRTILQMEISFSFAVRFGCRGRRRLFLTCLSYLRADSTMVPTLRHYRTIDTPDERA